MTLAISVENLVVARNGRRIIDNLSLSFPIATWTGVIGANGSGKTTLLKAIAGRLPVEAGRIISNDGQDISDRQARALSIGFAPDVTSLPGSLTGAEIISLMSEDHPAPLAAHLPLCKALGIDRLADLRINAMSSGMRQRIAIYLAFVQKSNLVILDEPFNWLDPVCTYDMKKALRSLVDEQGLCLITALHDMATLAVYCDEGVLLADGTVIKRMGDLGGRNSGGALADFEREMIAELRHK